MLLLARAKTGKRLVLAARVSALCGWKSVTYLSFSLLLSLKLTGPGSAVVSATGTLHLPAAITHVNYCEGYVRTGGRGHSSVGN